jgi:hypothetical protein
MMMTIWETAVEWAVWGLVALAFSAVVVEGLLWATGWRDIVCADDEEAGDGRGRKK